VEGGAPRCLTADYDRGAVILPRPAVTPGPVWSSNGGSVTFVAADAGSQHIVRADVTTGRVHPVVTGERQVIISSAAEKAETIAFIATDPSTPSDVFVCGWDGSGEARLTRVNEVLLSTVSLPRVERRTFEGAHGASLDGWLFCPANGTAPSPLLLDIHGGPHSFHGNQFSLGCFYRYVLASKGWAVLALNPTGSGSYGKAFAHGIRSRWGEFDLPEQLSAVDALVGEGLSDARRLAVAGYSYGGFMASWTITHTDRFKAAVVGAPVVNLESFHGTSDIGMWFVPWEMRGDLASQREMYRRLSPINYVERVTTPTLIVHGEADDRCPIGQSEELFIALIAAGRAPTEFVRYPGQGHLFLSSGRPSHRVDVNRRVIAWLEKYTLEGGPV
jgi:dipeptidyl aminopeptidase/acylaminoacyl peptidase